VVYIGVSLRWVYTGVSLRWVYTREAMLGVVYQGGYAGCICHPGTMVGVHLLVYTPPYTPWVHRPCYTAGHGYTADHGVRRVYRARA